MEMLYRCPLLVVVMTGLALHACAFAAAPPMYSAKEIHGQAVDAATGQPIEGAVIVAQWILFVGGIGHGGHNQVLHVAEVVTDKDGNYVIPGWGPKPRLPLTELDNQDPKLLVFKSGYKHQTLYNERDRDDSVRVSDWDGKVIRLEKFSGTAEERLDDLEFALQDSGAGDERVSQIFIEMLKEESIYSSWPVGAKPFFDHIRRLSVKGAPK